MHMYVGLARAGGPYRLYVYEIRVTTVPGFARSRSGLSRAWWAGLRIAQRGQDHTGHPQILGDPDLQGGENVRGIGSGRRVWSV